MMDKLSRAEQSKEVQRASNIIWNASGDYSFKPDIKAYDENGKANVYWNYIIGAVRRYYDYPQLQQFFSYLKKDHDHVIYENLVWIGLENCTYQRGKQERPVLDHLRRSYAKKVVSKADAASDYYLVEEIKKAHFQRALGEEPQMREQVASILDELEFDGSLTTGQIIDRMNGIINNHFYYLPARHNRNLLRNLFLSFMPAGNPFQKVFDFGNSQPSGEMLYLVRKDNQKSADFRWYNFLDQRTKLQREDIVAYYGASIFPEARTDALEHILCVGNHRNCHLHFTRGDDAGTAAAKKDEAEHRKDALAQREKNKKHYKANFAVNSHHILKLTNKIKNTILVNLDSSCSRAVAGKLATGKVWKSIYLNDNKIFIKDYHDDLGNLTVDIMLDASGSQINRQELISSEAYIIAESLTRCHIPVRVYAFNNKSNFAIMTLYRDYGEFAKNDRIFNYHSSGCNRDGLAIRTALHMMKDSRRDHKILIVLSDGKPNDPSGIPTGDNNPVQLDYDDVLGVHDTAMEVRKGLHEGVSILCVFTGLDEDVPSAKKIFGHNLARIKSPDKFADIVGVMIQNVLKNI